MDTRISKQMLAPRDGGQAATSRTALEWLEGAQATHPQPTIGGDRIAAVSSTASNLQEEARAAPLTAAISGGGHTAEDVAKQGKLLECLLAKGGASITPQKEITWDTEIEKLYYKEGYFYPLYRAATTWTARQGRTELPPSPEPKRNYGKQAPVYAHGPAEAQVVEDPPHPPPRRGMRWEDNPLRQDCHAQ